jgi:hypothetical protein
MAIVARNPEDDTIRPAEASLSRFALASKPMCDRIRAETDLHSVLPPATGRIDVQI